MPPNSAEFNVTLNMIKRQGEMWAGVESPMAAVLPGMILRGGQGWLGFQKAQKKGIWGRENVLWRPSEHPPSSAFVQPGLAPAVAMQPETGPAMLQGKSDLPSSLKAAISPVCPLF